MPWVDEFTDTFSDIFGKFVTSGYSVVDAGFDPAFPADFFPDSIIDNPPPTTVQSRERQRYALYVRDENRRLVGQIGDYVTGTITPRWPAAGPGEWHLTLPRDAPVCDLLLQPRTGIFVTRDEKPFFSGQKVAQERQYQQGRNVVTFDGIDDTALLSWRLVMTQPDRQHPPYVLDDNDIRKGPTSTIMWEYANVNIGPGAVPQRRWPGLTFAPDPIVGIVQTGHGKYQGLDLLLQQLGAASDPQLGYRITQSAPGSLQFEIVVPNDRTTTAVFSKDLGNITAYTHKESAGENYAVGGGSGNSIDRVIIEQADNNAIVQWGRIEGFNDHSDLTFIEDMVPALQADLVASANAVATTFTLADTSNLRYGFDYDLGDTVTVLVDGAVFREVIREISIALDKDDAIITPTVATAAFVKPGKTLVAAVIALKHQVHDLQRNAWHPVPQGA